MGKTVISKIHPVNLAALKRMHETLLLKAYSPNCTKTLKLSENIIHSRINAVKFYFEQVLHREKVFFEEIPRPKKRSTLPKVISKSDIIKLFALPSSVLDDL